MASSSSSSSSSSNNNPLLSHILRFVHAQLAARGGQGRGPTFIGISGPQGSGKTTVTTQLSRALRGAAPHGLRVAVLSIDDLYLPFAAQRALAGENARNPLLQHRGVPGTHDLALARRVLGALRRGEDVVALPVYDKSAHAGAGDRVAGEPVVVGRVDVVVLEGWCVGFRPLEEREVAEVWRRAGGVASMHRLLDLVTMNEALKGYDVITDMLDVLVHMDAQDISFVYDWRITQEHMLIEAKGQGMSDDEVRRFVDGYMPAYELYVPALRKGAFSEKGKQLRVVIGKGWEVVDVEEL